jgi:pyruvate/2-oxoglutarate dehydrogenase complex dihydrolipoamide dehydrogenase (E3) component
VAILLTGFAVKALYGNGSRRRGDLSLQDLCSPVNAIFERETEVVRAQFKAECVALYPGSTHFLDPHVVEVQGDGDESNVKGAKILVACGTRPAHSPKIPFATLAEAYRVAALDGLNKL